MASNSSNNEAEERFPKISYVFGECLNGRRYCRSGTNRCRKFRKPNSGSGYIYYICVTCGCHRNCHRREQIQLQPEATAPAPAPPPPPPKINHVSGHHWKPPIWSNNNVSSSRSSRSSRRPPIDKTPAGFRRPRHTGTGGAYEKGGMVGISDSLLPFKKRKSIREAVEKELATKIYQDEIKHFSSY